MKTAEILRQLADMIDQQEEPQAVPAAELAPTLGDDPNAVPLLHGSEETSCGCDAKEPAEDELDFIKQAAGIPVIVSI